MKKGFLTILAIISALLVFAQDPVVWNFRAKKISDKTYEIHISSLILSPWHIYSSYSSDAIGLPTTIVFKTNPVLSLKGKLREIGKMISQYEDIFKDTSKLYLNQVDFVQTITLKTKVKTNLLGSVEYVACKDERCLPVRKVPFSVHIE